MKMVRGKKTQVIVFFSGGKWLDEIGINTDHIFRGLDLVDLTT